MSVTCFNILYKTIGREVYDRVCLDESDINMSERHNIIRLNSSIYNQLLSKLFQTMISYSWHQSPGACRNVKEVCFSYTSDNCYEQHCDSSQCS
ncbi:unnamed protein product [Didymodactylos carnosus]|uniref:Uncharacterized protein n=1 Tax=Didymodactylos carnosus TaxID=1234261 RepID=A0A815JBJ7_9BILA|nr:unnamed protein product [Didymodactylos carnosus]CAF1417883.1 unnamed protein product [Didymodactylos carnosus]CAF4219666.1 unnamed protein product [Didymodactylos carnosus]CAF4271307.1 unnamed protein product [Didymodactylos carnosus]